MNGQEKFKKMQEVYSWMIKKGYDRKASKDISEIITHYLSEQQAKESEEVLDVVFSVLNDWVFNDENQAGDKLMIVDSHDFPQIMTEIDEKLKQ